MNKQKYNARATSLLLILVLNSFSPGVYSFPKTDMEFMQLPPFCKARASGSKSANWQYWEKRLGAKNFLHIHHLCKGMNDINKARLMSSRSKKFHRLLDSAETGGFNYVLNRTSKSFVLYALMLTQKAEIYLLRKKPEKAIILLNQAIQANPRYSPAYAKLSDIYKRQGKKKQAQEIITQGLTQKPTSKLLQLKLQKLM